MLSLSPEPDEESMKRLREYSANEASEAMSLPEPVVEGESGSGPKVAVLDLGVRRDTVAALKDRGCRLKIFPAEASAGDILVEGFDGIVIAGGPGNPRSWPQALSCVIRLSQSKCPVFGVGLGHQLLAMARGGETERMPRGHRGPGQPVRDVASGRVLTVAQNHGYVVTKLPEGGKVSYINCNDLSCEGIEYEDGKSFSVQFVPGEDMFDKFVMLCKEGERNASC